MYCSSKQILDQGPYGADPYGDYYTNPDVLFPISNKDDRLGLKETVVGLEYDGVHKAYNIQDVQKNKVINDQIGKESVALFSLYPLMARYLTHQSMDRL